MLTQVWALMGAAGLYLVASNRGASSESASSGSDVWRFTTAAGSPDLTTHRINAGKLEKQPGASETYSRDLIGR